MATNILSKWEHRMNSTNSTSHDLPTLDLGHPALELPLLYCSGHKMSIPLAPTLDAHLKETSLEPRRVPTPSADNLAFQDAANEHIGYEAWSDQVQSVVAANRIMEISGSSVVSGTRRLVDLSFIPTTNVGVTGWTGSEIEHVLNDSSVSPVLSVKEKNNVENKTQHESVERPCWTPISPPPTPGMDLKEQQAYFAALTETVNPIAARGEFESHKGLLWEGAKEILKPYLLHPGHLTAPEFTTLVCSQGNDTSVWLKEKISPITHRAVNKWMQAHRTLLDAGISPCQLNEYLLDAFEWMDVAERTFFIQRYKHLHATTITRQKEFISSVDVLEDSFMKRTADQNVVGKFKDNAKNTPADKGYSKCRSKNSEHSLEFDEQMFGDYPDQLKFTLDPSTTASPVSNSLPKDSRGFQKTAATLAKSESLTTESLTTAKLAEDRDADCCPEISVTSSTSSREMELVHSDLLDRIADDDSWRRGVFGLRFPRRVVRHEDTPHISGTFKNPKPKHARKKLSMLFGSLRSRQRAVEEES